jgi:hypothetical protein
VLIKVPERRKIVHIKKIPGWSGLWETARLFLTEKILFCGHDWLLDDALSRLYIGRSLFTTLVALEHPTV